MSYGYAHGVGKRLEKVRELIKENRLKREQDRVDSTIFKSIVNSAQQENFNFEINIRIVPPSSGDED